MKSILVALLLTLSAWAGPGQDLDKFLQDLSPRGKADFSYNKVMAQKKAFFTPDAACVVYSTVEQNFDLFSASAIRVSTARSCPRAAAASSVPR